MMREWSLRELWTAAGLAPDGQVPEIRITQVTDDSRAVREGALFVALRGAVADGHLFLAQAIGSGARAVVIEEDRPVPPSVVKLRVPSTRSVLGPLAHAFAGSSSHQLQLVGVTGTKGKTTVAWLVRHLLESIGVPCGLIGTVCHLVGTEERMSGNTTPGAVELQDLLARMVAHGQKACAMEVSSHALDQNRTDGVRWACGVFTNFAPEHLDYHRTMQHYLESKLRLFRSLGRDAHAVVNVDDPSGELVRGATAARVTSYGLQQRADLTARRLRSSLDGLELELVTREGTFAARSRLIGLHNAENLLAALGAARALGVPVRRVVDSLAEFKGVPGRLERIEAGQPFPVFVDYAHTDGALRRVLTDLRALTPRCTKGSGTLVQGAQSGWKIITVFGCGGDRDRAKRPRMGRVAAELSDRVIVTSDNPRSEDPGEIARQIVAGMEGLATPFQVLLDRREAIRAALEQAQEDWLVLIAGKGHETAQIFSDQAVPFDDRAVVRELLQGARVG